MIPVPLKKILPSLPFTTIKKAEVRDRDLYLRDSDFLTEETFRELLCFERKRSERSGKAIGVMLLDITAIDDRHAKYKLIHRVPQTVAGMTGSGHTLGWYRSDREIGIIVTETNGAKEDLPNRLMNALLGVLSERQAHAVRFRWCSFPQNGGPGDPEEGAVFYADLLEKEKSREVALLLKRLLDIFGGTAGLLLFSPFFVVLPLLIKATSNGPVLFKQERVGRHGERFLFLKFRSMFVNNDPRIHQEYIRKFIREQKSFESAAGTDSVFKIKNDPRVTPLGRFMRKTSLDELPQFLNVLKGEMSLVGPRPPIPYELENYDLWHRRRVMEIKPGITGLWQVLGRSRTTFDEMVRLDLKYAKEWSLWLDIKIILKTPWVVLSGKGGY